MKSEFVQPILEGAHFDAHTLPLEVARDLAAYETLVIELAKHLYLDDHKDRQRVPKGFAADFHFHLERIDPGSSKPLLSIVASGALALSGGTATYFEKARDLVADCIAAGGQLPAGFPRNLLTHFNQIGRTLREDESLTFQRPASAPPAVLTPERRKHLVLAAEKVYEREIELSGSIIEANWDKSTFQPNHELSSKFDELRSLQDGWHDGQGSAPTGEGLDLIAEHFVRSFPGALPLPSIIPTPEGDLLFEWNVKGDPSLDVNLSTLGAQFHAFGEDGGDSEDWEEEFDLSGEAGWTDLLDFLANKIGSV